MKVKDLLPIIDKLQRILKYYREYSLEEMIEDIYGRCCVEKKETLVPAVEHDTTLPGENSIMPEDEAPGLVSDKESVLFNKDNLPPPELAIKNILGIPEEELSVVLGCYGKNDLYAMVKILNIKGHSKSNKKQLVAALKEWAREPQPPVKKEANRGQQALATRTSAPSAGSVPAKAAREQSASKPALPEAARLIPEMEKEEAMAFLAGFTRAELKEIAGLLNLSISRMATKNNMILMMVNHFSYIKLHQQMGQRPRQ